MGHLRSLRLWFGVPAVLVGVTIGVLTNIATTAPSLPIVAGLVAAVVMLVGLTVRQAGRDEQGRVAALRAARKGVLNRCGRICRGHTRSALCWRRSMPWRRFGLGAPKRKH